MLKGLMTKAHTLILENREEEISKEYPHYDVRDRALVTQFDSNNFTQWKQGADNNVLLSPVIVRHQLVVKDVPFEIKPLCNCGG